VKARVALAALALLAASAAQGEGCNEAGCPMHEAEPGAGGGMHGAMHGEGGMHAEHAARHAAIDRLVNGEWRIAKSSYQRLWEETTPRSKKTKLGSKPIKE